MAARAEELIERVERLSGELEGVADPHARGVAEELMAAVLELYGEGLDRVMQLVEEVGPEGRRCATRWPRTAWWPACS